MQAITDIVQFNEMNDCANKSLLEYAHEKHKEEMSKAGMKHEQEITSLEDKNVELLESVANQAALIGSLNSLNMDSAQTISSLTQLLHEKDMVRTWQMSLIENALYVSGSYSCRIYFSS